MTPHYHINKLKTDNNALISTENYEYSELLQKFDIYVLTHYVNELTNDDALKIKRTESVNFKIINDIDNIHLVNNEIKDNYYENWKNKIFNIHQIYSYIEYDIYLLTN